MMTLAVVIVLLVAAFYAGFVVGRRGRQTNNPPQEPLPVVVDKVRRALADRNDVEVDIAVRDAQAKWLRDQERITADSVVDVVQRIRAAIVHAGAPEARALLDDLQREATAQPDGLPGPLVASARLRFDELMRRNVQ